MAGIWTEASWFPESILSSPLLMSPFSSPESKPTSFRHSDYSFWALEYSLSRVPAGADWIPSMGSKFISLCLFTFETPTNWALGQKHLSSVLTTLLCTPYYLVLGSVSEKLSSSQGAPSANPLSPLQPGKCAPGLQKGEPVANVAQ